MAEMRLTSFQRIIEKNLWPDNAFYKNSKNAGQPNAEKIVIPQSSSLEEPILGGVTAGYYTTANNMKAATALAPVINVNDKLEYTNNIVRLPHPIVIEKLQEDEVGYNKAETLAQDQAENIMTAVANLCATLWAPTNASYIIPTVGLNAKNELKLRASSVGAKGGYAGNVKRFQYEDLLALESTIMRQNLAGGNWYALPTVEQWEDLRRIADIIDFEKTGNSGMLEKGIIGKWGLINYLKPRQNDKWNSNLLFDITNPAAPVAVAYAGALNANCVSSMLVWNDQYVERNEGSVQFFSRKDDPIYMGDLFNWGVRFGASKRRLDGKGVIAVYETPDAGGQAIV